MIRDGSGFSIAVVFRNENHWQFPDASKIQSLVEGTLVSGAIAKETHSYLAFTIVFRGESCSSREGEPTANDAISAEHSFVHVRDMH